MYPNRKHQKSSRRTKEPEFRSELQSGLREAGAMINIMDEEFHTEIAGRDGKKDLKTGAEDLAKSPGFGV